MAKKKITEMVNTMTPQRVKKDTITLWDYPCDTSAVKLVEYIAKTMKEHGEDINFRIDYGGLEYGDGLQIEIETFRDETPAEVQKRIEKDQKRKEKAAIQRVKRKEKDAEKKKKEAEQEIKLLLKLKEKYKDYTIESI